MVSKTLGTLWSQVQVHAFWSSRHKVSPYTGSATADTASATAVRRTCVCGTSILEVENHALRITRNQRELPLRILSAALKPPFSAVFAAEKFSVPLRALRSQRFLGNCVELHGTRGRSAPAAPTHPPETAAAVGRSRRTRDETLRALCSRFGDRDSGSACRHETHDQTSTICSGD